MNISEMESLLLSQMEAVKGGNGGETCVCQTGAILRGSQTCECQTGALLAGSLRP